VQLVALNEPLELREKAIDPAGTVRVAAGPESVTVAVHVVGWPTVTAPGAQTTAIVLGRGALPGVTVTGVDVLLPTWSPAYPAVTWWVPDPTADGV
jgi:hypothetical protein